MFVWGNYSLCLMDLQTLIKKTIPVLIILYTELLHSPEIFLGTSESEKNLKPFLENTHWTR